MDLITLSERIENAYRRYLKTTFYFRDATLRRSFEKALNSGHLRKGPYLEATPVFKRGEAPAPLLAGLVGSRPAPGLLQAMAGERRLYSHQEAAVLGVGRGRNALVATGTGSGKTEAFLYPILIHLYQEFLAESLGPGVRALILYPMNALANDQRERLGAISKALVEAHSRFGFTFGQYTGETPEDANDSRRYARDRIARRLSGELVLRTEMRSAPPNILLTNYSMLEYLLLRPDDSPLFDDGRARDWTFLVLDEVHQYRGSRGIEMGMLVRRLKRRLKEGGRAGPFRCIATSATLAGGEEDAPAVAKFASDLFGEEFGVGDVILGKTESIPEAGFAGLHPEAYEVLGEGLRGGDIEASGVVAKFAAAVGVRAKSEEDVAALIARCLERETRATRLRHLITGQPGDVRAIAAQLFDDLPEGEQLSALSKLVGLLVSARSPESGAPLLSARYHLFLRSLEGAFISYWPEKGVFLDRKTTTEEEAAFEVALCRECGQHYLVGAVKGGRLMEAVRDPSQFNFGATFLRPIENDSAGDDGEEPGGNEPRPVLHLCVRCGELRRGNTTCGHQNSIPVIKEDAPGDEDRADQMAKCGACGYSAAGRDPVREVVHGTDGPNAVIATALYDCLPEGRRKVLAFADSRQEAAFFAWYLEDSYKEILGRNLILNTINRLSQHSEGGLSLRELATHLRAPFRAGNMVLAATGELELQRATWLALYREFLTDEPRISLEGVGLVRWFVQWPPWLRVTATLMTSPLALTEPEAQELLGILLDTMRSDRAVEIRTDDAVALNWSDLGLQASQMRVRIGAPNGRRGVRSWDGRTGKRVRLLVKLLRKADGSLPESEAVVQALALLRGIWETIAQSEEKASSRDERLFIYVDDSRRLNPDWWRVRFVSYGESIFRCDTCGRLQGVSVRGVCPRDRCRGTLRELKRESLEPNHYRALYEENLPGRLRVEEHTAQLDAERARQFQREFKNGGIHILSCSTTFELGVDLGDLDTIFLRNVPPEAFNYAQRVGRAGRRSGYPGFAVTYCRRGPHDLYHFAEPQRMLSGKVRPPVLSLRNEKIISRHVAATALSHFFRACPERFRTVEGLIKDFENPQGARDVRRHLEECKNVVEESLRAIVPPECGDSDIGLRDGSWIGHVAGKDSDLDRAEAGASDDWRQVKRLESTAAAGGDYDTARWARARAKTIAEEDVLSFLSRKAAIPKYGFPVDVVELDTQKTQHARDEVLLQRDLSIAISEFAPTGKLVANKKVWTSYGLKRVREREWARRWYKRCVRHNVFLQWERGQAEPPTPCGDSLSAFEYVIPRYGFVTNRDRPKNPTSRPARVFSTRPYFMYSQGLDTGIVTMPSGPSSHLLSMKKASPGWMAVLCEGRRGEGFYICGACGAGFRKRERIHESPYGEECRGSLEQVSLGHEFVTDVLRLQFHPRLRDGVETIGFAFSLAYALVEGAAETLEIPSIDLSATAVYGSGEHSPPPIVLYDNVPGGAGLVARLEGEEILLEVLGAARKRVMGDCGCDAGTSCYGCLRNYRNQFAHQYLQRGPVLDYLEKLLLQWGGSS